MNENDIENIFTYHNPTDIDPQIFKEIRDNAKELGKKILKYGHRQEDIIQAILKLRECVFYSIASIVIPK